MLVYFNVIFKFYLFAQLEELIAKGHMKKMTGRGPKNRDIDQALYTWYCERKNSF